VWAEVARADRYRVWRQLPTDPAPVVVATVTDNNATLTEQPPGVEIKVSVTASNEAGEGVPTAQSVITLA
jgi:hypothetical protein